MFIQLYGKTIGLLKYALDVQSERHQAITSNIANQDTPGYRGTDVNFRESLDQILGPAKSIPLAKTHPGHISGGAGPSALEMVHTPTKGTSRLDGNTVNPEKEMAKLAQNTMMYHATVEMISKKFKMLREAIREGR